MRFLCRLPFRLPAAAGAVRQVFSLLVGQELSILLFSFRSCNLQLCYGYKQLQVDQSVTKAPKTSFVTFPGAGGECDSATGETISLGRWSPSSHPGRTCSASHPSPRAPGAQVRGWPGTSSHPCEAGCGEFEITI